MAFTVFYRHWFKPIDEIQKVSPAFLSKMAMFRVMGLILGTKPSNLRTCFCCSRRSTMENVTLLFQRILVAKQSRVILNYVRSSFLTAR